MSEQARSQDQQTKKRRMKGQDNGEKAESRKARFIKKILGGNKAIQEASFIKRKQTLKKKAGELQKLCDVEVSMVCFGPDGSLDIFPDHQSKLRQEIMAFKGLDEQDKCVSNLFDFFDKKKGKLEEHKNKAMKKRLDEVNKSLFDWVGSLSGDSLKNAVNCLENMTTSVKQRIEFLESTWKIRESPDHQLVELCGETNLVTQPGSGVTFGTSEISALEEAENCHHDVLMQNTKDDDDFWSWVAGYSSGNPDALVDDCVAKYCIDPQNSEFGRSGTSELQQAEVYNRNAMEDNVLPNNTFTSGLAQENTNLDAHGNLGMIKENKSYNSVSENYQTLPLYEIMPISVWAPQLEHNQQRQQPDSSWDFKPLQNSFS